MGISKKIRQKWANMRFKSKGVAMGEGSRIDGTVDISIPKNVALGKNSILYKQTCIYPSGQGRFSMGSHSHIAPFGYLLIDKNAITIGDHVAIGPYCSMICHSNAIEGEAQYFADNYLDADIVIGSNVFIGAQCTILPGTIIGDNVVIAANSVVRGNLQPNFVYGGSPVKKIKPIDAEA